MWDGARVGIFGAAVAAASFKSGVDFAAERPEAGWALK